MKKFSLIALFLIFSPLVLHAQVNLGGGPILGTLADELNVTFAPTYPRPGEVVSIILEMYTEDLNSANISYLLDGKVQKSGKGLKQFSFASPSVGKSVNLSISVNLQSGASFTKDIQITPASVELLSEAISYTPPFYRGKALSSPQGYTKLQAVAHFSVSATSLNNNSDLVYTWTVDGDVRGDLGGYGKNTALIKGDLLGISQEVEVLVTDPITNVTAQGSTFINPSDPAIVFYENSPLYGIIFERALVGSVELENEETSILAAPFNISKENINSLDYSWRINGQSAEITGRSAIFRRPEGVSGASSLSLEVSNPSKILQQGQNSFIINFKEN